MTRDRWKASARLALAALILVFLVGGVWTQWDRLQAQGVHIRWGWAAAATALNVVFFAIQAEIWRRCVGSSGGNLAFGPALSIWASSQVAKYVPGKVMLPLVRIGWSGRTGTPAAAATVGLYIEIVLMIVSSTLVFLLFAGHAVAGLDRWPPWLFPAMALSGLLSVHPRAIERGVNFGLTRIKRAPIRIELRYAAVLIMTAALMIGWMVHGLSAIACLRALGADWSVPYPVLTGIFSLSWLIGFLSFLTPGGIGVREGVIVLALAPWLASDAALAVSVTSRFAWILAEVALAAAFFAVRPKPAPVAAEAS